MKTSRRIQLLLFGFVFAGSFATSACADPMTVIVDLNDSPQEIDAISRSVGKENLIIIPERTGKQTEILERLAKAKAELRRIEAIEKVLAPAEKTARMKIDQPLKDNINSQANGIRKELIEAYGGALPTEAQISAQILAAMSDHKVNRFVVSGEHFEEHTTGELGILRDNSFINMVDLNSPKFEAVKSLYFLRCDTGGTNQNLLWKSVMHGLVQTVYYSAQAPSSSNGAGLAVLGATVSKEQKLLEAYEKDADHKAFFAAAQAAMNGTSTSAVVCVCEACYSNRSLAKSLGCTPEGYSHVNEVMDLMDMVIQDPNDPDNDFYCNTSTSPDRSRYDDLEEYQSCDRTAKNKKLREAFLSRMSDLYRPGALTFFQNVASNFAQYNKSDLDSLNRISKKYPGLAMVDISQPLSCVGTSPPHASLSRRALLSWIGSLGKATSGMTEREKDCVMKMQTRMNMQLTRLYCIPERWVHDPNFAISTQAPESPECQTVMAPACR